MSNQPKLLPLISELGNLTLNVPTIGGVDTLTSPDQGFPQNLRLVYVQQNYRESMPLKNSIYLTFDPSKASSITEFPAFSSVENDVLADSYSPSRQYRALLRKGAENKMVLEIWGKNGLCKSFRVSDFHGAVYAGPIFCMGSALAWSKDEKRIVYIAEKKVDPVGKYYDGLDSDDQVSKIMDKFAYKQDLGEDCKDRRAPLLFIYDVEEGELHQVLNVPKDVIPTYPGFVDKEGKSLIFCGFTFKDFMLGLKSCSNRPSQIFHAQKLVLQKMEKPKKPNGKETKDNAEGEQKKEDPEEKKKKLEQESEQNMAVKLNEDPISTCPTVSNDFTKVAYFFSPWKHTHSMGLGLKVLKLNEEAGKKEELVLDVVQEKRKEEEFPGITGYTDILVKTSWIGDEHVVINTYRGYSLAIYIVNVRTKEVRRIDQQIFKSDEWRLRAVCGDLIISTVSNPDGANKIAIYQGVNLKADTLENALKVAKWHYFKLTFKGFDSNVVNNFESNGNVDERVLEVDGVESLFFAAKEIKDEQGNVIPYHQRPLIVFPHGGPHNVSTGAFTVLRYYLQSHGFNLLYPCFTGSLGYGQKFLEDLAGKIGEIDTNEIMSSIEYCIKEGLCDAKKVGILGGSYGGFLCGVLLAKFSEMFKCALIYNPAVNVHHQWVTSDIPDWGPSEALNKDTAFDINADEVKKMYDMSPISMYKGKEVKSSILLFLGLKDKRVPWGSGLQYYNMLKSKGADVKLLTYAEGDHFLTGNPDVEFDQLIQTVFFINEKLGHEKAAENNA